MEFANDLNPISYNEVNISIVENENLEKVTEVLQKNSFNGDNNNFRNSQDNVLSDLNLLSSKTNSSLPGSNSDEGEERLDLEKFAEDTAYDNSEKENKLTAQTINEVNDKSQKLINLVNKKRFKSRIKFPVNSDSEDEALVDNLISTEDVNVDEKVNNEPKKRLKKAAVIDSDSDAENEDILDKKYNTMHAGNSSGESKKKLTRCAVIDSDSDVEDQNVQNEILNENVSCNVEDVYHVNKNGELVSENTATTIQKSRCSPFSDSESSNEPWENGNNTFEEETSGISSESNKPKKGPKTKHCIDKGPKKMTGKEALEQRKEIHSQSQRRVRELQVSLPYHRPKSRTLKEFLQKRPRFAAALPNSTIHTRPSIAIKMSTQQLESVSKKLEEREKELEEFFKSESESDDECPEEYIPGESPQQEASLEVNKIDEGNVDKIDDKMVSDNTCTENFQCVLPDAINEKCDVLSDKVDEIHADTISTEAQNTEKISNNLISDEIVDDSRIEVEQNEVLNITKATEEINLPLAANSEAGIEHCTRTPLDGSTDSCNQTDQIIHIKNVALTETECYMSGSIRTICNQMENNTNDDNQDCAEKTILKDDTDSNSNVKNNSEEFEFDLNDEDFGEETKVQIDRNCEQVKLERLIQKYCGQSDAVQNSENNLKNFLEERIQNDERGTEEEDAENKQTKRKSKLELLKETLGTYKPKLSGGPDQVINLDKDVTPTEVSQLMERYMQHISRKSHHKTQVHVDVISVTDGEIRKETVAVPIDVEEEPVAAIEKPGAKLKKLRDELQIQMSRRRSEFWRQKAETNGEKIIPDVDNDESVCKVDDDILDDDEEEDFTDSESEDPEEELDKEKPHKKLAFADEEAEESEGADEDEDLNEKLVNGEVIAGDEELVNNENECENEDNIDSEEDEKDDYTDQHEEDADGDDENDETVNVIQKKRKLKRIIKPFSNDSDDSNDSELSTQEDKPVPEIVRHKNKSKDDSTDTWDDSGPPPNQPESTHTPRRNFTQTKSDLGFLTPVFRLTGLQNFDPNSIFLHDSPVTPFDIGKPSPLHNSQEHHKRLFDDVSPDMTDPKASAELAEMNSEDLPTQALPHKVSVTQKTMDEIIPSTQDLLDICSGSFSPSTQRSVNIPVTTQDLLEISSGKFSGINYLNTIESGEASHSSSNKPVNSSEVIVSAENTTDKLTEYCGNTVSEIKNLGDDNDDKLISQILDEEELEKFKKKFESPLVRPTETKVTPSPSKVGRFIFDSSDEEENSDAVRTKKRKRKQLVFSDEEEENEESQLEEAIDLHDECHGNTEVASDIEETYEGAYNKEDRDVAYDSEENEIEVYEQENKKQQIKITDFVENEAELSESEWGSDDEDENNLDELEFELGDTDKIDERKVRRDLERIHMRQVLDDDNREVKILQELLLEDGELHGTGRQRQFRWKNIDSMGNDDETPKEEDSELHADEEAETDEHWRKVRYEREIFLKKKENSQDLDDISLSCNSQVFKLGQAAIRKSLTNSQNSTLSEKSQKNVEPSSPDIKQPITLSSTRGSFLSRSDQVLTRLAEFTKTGTTSGGLKNSRNFIFQTVSVVSETSVTAVKKRKASDGTPTAIKKLRLTELSPAIQKKSEKSNKAKKLFSNW